MPTTTPAPPTAAVPHAEAAFLALLPALVAAARRRFRFVRCPDRRADLAGEVVALAWLWHRRLLAHGRDPAAFAAVFARTAARAVGSGRRLCGQEKARDVLSARCQRRRGLTVTALPAGAGAADDPLAEALRDNTRTPVPDQVQFRLDFPAWAGRLPAAKRRVADLLAAGHRPQDVAAAAGLTPGRVSQLRREFHAGYAAFCDGAAT